MTSFLEVSMGPGGLLPHFELRQEGQMPSEAFNCRRMPPVRQHCRRGAPNQGIRLRQLKTIERSAIPKVYMYSLKSDEKKQLERNGPRRHLTIIFEMLCPTWAHGTGAGRSRGRSEAPGTHFCDLAPIVVFS